MLKQKGRRYNLARLWSLLGLMAFWPHAGGAAPLAGNPQAGQAVFKLCASCHQLGPRARGGFGPQLTGVIGRKAASTGDYHYSEAMQKSAIVWSEDRLAAFIRDPDRVVPGTRMRFWGISDEQKIADLLAYLKASAQ